MTVKSSISLTDEQHGFARELVSAGRYPSVSAVVAQGLELLKARSEAESMDRSVEVLARGATARGFRVFRGNGQTAHGNGRA